MTIYFLKPWCWANTNYLSSCVCFFFCVLLGPVPVGDYRIGSNFWKFYLIKPDFTLGDPVSLVEMFRLFKLEWIFLGVQECGHSTEMYNILSIGRASVFVMPCWASSHCTSIFPVCCNWSVSPQFLDHCSIKCVGSEICITNVISQV
jgi:hypothetical protein